MKASFSIEGLQSPAEVAVAWKAVEEHRQSAKPFAESTESKVDQLDGATTELALRIFKGLTMGPLGPSYKAILQTLLDAPAGETVTINELEKKVGRSKDELRSNLSKLSARMKRIANTEEAATLRTPFLLLADIEYDERNSSRYRLTPAGREAVRRYLRR